MKHFPLRSVMAILLFASALHGQYRDVLIKTVTDSSSWSPASPPSEYDETNVDRLSARIAPVAKRFGLLGVTVQEWTGPGGSARTTLYEMLDSAASYGLFAWQRNSEDPSYASFPAGAEGFRTSSGAIFWQSNYVVTITGSVRAADDLAQAISQNIFGQSRKPPVSEWLPPNGLVQGSEKYIISTDDVDRRVGVDQAAMGFDDSVEVATARYNVDGQQARLTLLLYPTQQIAKKYGDALPATGPNGPVFQKRVAALVAVVSGTRNAAVADKIFADVNYETKVTWNERKPGLALGVMIVTIFTFIGVALLFTLVAGISFGGLRVFVKSRYPNKIFDRAQDMEIIQLKLDQGVIRRELHE
jgi:hypothetical protein